MESVEARTESGEAGMEAAEATRTKGAHTHAGTIEAPETAAVKAAKPAAMESPEAASMKLKGRGGGRT
jgi:hypothetical protein